MAGENQNSRCNLGSTKGDLGPPQCANKTWNIWVEGEDGYFCCEEGLHGFKDSESSSVGCVSKADVDEGYQNGTMGKLFPLGMLLLRPLPRGSQLNIKIELTDFLGETIHRLRLLDRDLPSIEIRSRVA